MYFTLLSSSGNSQWRFLKVGSLALEHCIPHKKLHCMATILGWDDILARTTPCWTQPELLQCKVQRGSSYGHYKTPVIYKLFSITWCYRMHNSNTCRFCSILTPDNSSCYTNKVGLGLDLTQTFLSNFWCRNRASIAVQPKKTMSQQRRNYPTERRDSGHKTCHYESAVI